MESVNNKKINIFKDKIKRFLIFTITFIITYSLIILAVSPKKYDLKIGDIAPADIRAPRETVDEVESKRILDEALQNVDLQYTKKKDVKLNSQQNIKNLFEEIIYLVNSKSDQKDKVKALGEYGGFSLTESQCVELLSLSEDALKNLQWEIIEILESVYDLNIQDGDNESLSIAKDVAVEEIENLNLTTSMKDLVSYIVLSEVKPNLFYDEDKTNEMKKEVRENTAKVIIKKNQTIVNEGDPITEAQLEVLTDLGLLSDGEKSGSLVLLYLLIALFVGVILYLQILYIKKNHKSIYQNNKQLILIFLLNMISLVLASTVRYVSPYLIPLTCVPLLLTLLINYKVSLVLSLYNVVLLSALVEFDVQIIIMAIISSILGATILRKMQQRNDIIYVTVLICVISGILNFSVGVMISSNTKEILLNSFFVMLGVLISGILTIGILPFLEGTFDVVTTLKLLELSNPNNPLLKKLLMESPGTYHHSMLVANLAEMAAEEIGANTVITRIGAYYHDIGKTSRPYFFRENQIGSDNPHNKITAALSAKIIISHVKDGLELAREYKVPKVIQDIIAEHHGTTFVKYFYITEKNNSKNPDSIDENDYKYPGPIPSTRESGIIMLADSVEAAVRSITSPTNDKIEEMVSNIIQGKVNDKQLNNCDLTFKDLEKIKGCFLKALKGIYHERIEYPTEKVKELDKDGEKNKQ